MSGEIIIRDLERWDITAAANIIESNWNKEIAIKGYLEMQEMFLGSSKWPPHYYVAEIDGQVVGCGGFAHSWCMSNTYEFCWVNVKKDLQNKGIGRLLTQARINGIKQQGGKLILVVTQSPQHFEYFGFERIKTLQGVDGFGDWYLMSLQLGLVNVSGDV